jgi:ribosomal protein L13E
MRELIDRVVKVTGLDAEHAERAVGITLSLIRRQGNPEKVEELFAKLPGADRLATQHAKAGRQGGLFGTLGGLVGGPLAAVSQLKAAGLTLDQIKALGAELLDYARQKAGPEIVREVTGSIPGLSGYA